MVMVFEATFQKVGAAWPDRRVRSRAGRTMVPPSPDRVVENIARSLQPSVAATPSLHCASSEGEEHRFRLRSSDMFHLQDSQKIFATGSAGPGCGKNRPPRVLRIHH